MLCIVSRIITPLVQQSKFSLYIERPTTYLKVF